MIKPRYRIYSSAILNVSVEEAWSEMKDFSRMIKAAFSDGISDIRWVDGGSADKIPSRIEFVLHPGGVVAREELIGISEHTYSLVYRTVSNVMNIVDYIGFVQCYRVTDEPNRTFLETIKEFCLTDGTDVDEFLRMYEALVHQETRNLRDYFAKRSSA